MRLPFALSFALSLLSCATPPSNCGYEDGGADALVDELVLGEIVGGEFRSFDGEAMVVMGAQGGWMVLLVVEVPMELVGEHCIELDIRPSLGGVGLAPIQRASPSTRWMGPIPILIGFDFDPDQRLTLLVTARTASARAVAEVDVELRTR